MLSLFFASLPKVSFTCLLRSTVIGGVVLGVAMIPGEAFALDFRFTFSGLGNPSTPAAVSGVISGLVDNMNDQKTGLTATIISATNTPVGGWPTFTSVFVGNGLDVSAGVVTGANVSFQNGVNLLLLGNKGDINADLINIVSNDKNYDTNSTSSNSLRFIPYAPPVPGPLPLLGAAFAFRASRQLRRRSKNTV